MYSWHGTANHPPNPAAAANPRLDTSASTATTAHTQQSQHHQQSQAHAQQQQQSQYQMPQLRWLPSMMSRSPNLPHGLPTMSPNMSPNMRVGGIVPGSTAAAAAVAAAASGGGQVAAHHGHHHNQHTHTHTHTHHRQVQAQVQPSVAPVVVDARAPVVEEIASSSESDETDPTIARDSTISAQVDTTTSTLGTGNTQPRQHGLDRMTDGDNEDDDDTGAAATGAGDAGDTNRKHGKRLTTKEEVCLFDICNRHAGEFGQRSNLCKWWMTVTEEFTREQGHPYSWHSVRRKVEMMTKQRMKFLDELREKGGIDPEDISNPRWRNAIDSWIPTWRRWEEAEAKRIEKRDSRRPRKRKDRSWEGATATPTTAIAPGGGGAGGGTGGWESTPLSTPTLDSQSSASSAMVHSSLPPPVTPLPPQNTVRLPPGFDNMFSSQPRTTPTAPVFSSPPPPPQPRPQQQQQPPQQPGLTTPSAKDEAGVMSAVLETLGKLNRHLDAASSDPRSSPLGSNAKSDALNGIRASDRRGVSNGDDVGGIVSSAIMERVKDEIRQEMRSEWRAEMERDRTALEEKLESVQRTQEMIIQMLRQQSA